MESLFSENIKRALEALLFVAGEPLSVEELARHTKSDETTIEESLKALAAEFAQRGFYLAEVGGGWQFMTQPDLHEYVQRLYQPKARRLSKAALETLAIIAYCQPVTRGEIEEIRGVNADGIVSNLLERGLLDEVGRKESAGKPVLYATNRKFLELLGLNSLAELPPLELPREKEPSLFAEQQNQEPHLFPASEKEVQSEV